MSESAREGGVCTLSVEPRQLRLECSPGARRTRFELRVLDRAGAKTTIETVGDGGAGERLEVETLAGPGGRRALRIVVAGRPGSTPLGAYGRPDLWVEAPAGEAR